jgi:hypothetical protein
LTKKSVADCLQTRPVDHQKRLIRVRGKVDREDLVAKTKSDRGESVRKTWGLPAVNNLTGIVALRHVV